MRLCGSGIAWSATSDCAPTATTSTSSRREGSRPCVDDPYVERVDARAGVRRGHVALIGGGFAGLCVGARLKQAGIDDVRIVEDGGDFGGTWYWNRYPGAQCDTAVDGLPAAARGDRRTCRRASTSCAPEIFAHCRRIADTFDLYEQRAASRPTVTELELGRRRRPRWIIRTNRGDAFTSQVRSHGHRPAATSQAAGHPRHRDLRGPQFHTSRWDYDYTGGDWTGGADDRAGRQARRHHRHRGHRGAVRPARWRGAARSSTCSSARRRRSTCATTTPIDPDWFAELEPGWQQRWLRELRRPADRRLRRRGPGEGRLDRHLAAHP